MLKTTLGKNLTTVTDKPSHQALHTAFLEPRTDVNPGEMLAASLGACMMTMIGYMAHKRGDNAEGSFVEINPQFDEKHTRITGFELTFVFPDSFTSEQKDLYVRAAQTCPVHNSLREDMKYSVTVK